MRKCKFIFVTGGVVSSLGKGVATASLGFLLQSMGFKIKLRKLDPYLNIDPGNMNPTQHGEIFVTKDGAEADLDLGHYERFTGIETTKADNITTGKIYYELLNKERRGEYLGNTVQVIPHVTDLIKKFILHDTEDLDFLLCEIGGTVGDIEAQPFLEAVRQIGFEMKVLYIHLIFVPFIKTSNEFKTKPTQHSVKMLNSSGIWPNILICRMNEEFSVEDRKKISNFCNVSEESVIPAIDVNNIYSVPVNFYNSKLHIRALDHFGISYKHSEHCASKVNSLNRKCNMIGNFCNSVTVCIVGKYMKLEDAYKSVVESLKHGAFSSSVDVNIKFINSREINEENISIIFVNVDVIVVPGGFGEDGMQGKILAIKYARENNIPFLGICFGMQLAIIEFAQNVLHLEEVGSEEFGNFKNKIIKISDEQKIKDKEHLKSIFNNSNFSGVMRLGSYKCKLKKGSKISSIYNAFEIEERHRHRYETDIRYLDILERGGMLCTGFSTGVNVFLESVEIATNDFFIAVQFHPEFKSSLFKPHPLFIELITAAKKAKYNEETVCEEEKMVATNY